MDVLLSGHDGTSLDVSFQMPYDDGGSEIDVFKIEWDTEEFKEEVQEIRLRSSVTTTIQEVATSADDEDEVQVVRTYGTGSGASNLEVQSIECDATGGSFTLSFNHIFTHP